jgi:hypothetical protein
VAERPSQPPHLHHLLVYTSWLNQIEMRFRTLVRRLLQHGDFTSLDHLEAQTYAFIATHHRLHALPYQAAL